MGKGFGQSTLEQLAQSESNAVPIILEKCVQFVEEEGLDSEGIYRVPGNRAHVELLFQKFDEGNVFTTLVVRVKPAVFYNAPN